MIITTHPEVYEPAEDSYLLINALRKARALEGLQLLDMGCGTGTVGLHAAMLGAHVTLVDCNEDAVRLAQQNADQNRLSVSVVSSDMFTHVEHRLFDVITCNAPYLPDDAREADDSITRSIAGGKHGYEWSARFLSEAREYLQPNGVVLLVVSSLSKPHVLETYMRDNGFSYAVVAKQHLGGFETLYVYACQFVPVVRVWRRNGMQHMHVADSGKRGIVYKGQWHDDWCAVKTARTPGGHYDAVYEASLLQEVNAQNIGPQYRAHDSLSLCMEWIEGSALPDVLDDSNRVALCAQLLDQARVLDNMGIHKKEFTRPYANVLVKQNGQLVLLDFERAIRNSSPKNVTQCVQFIMREHRQEQHILRSLLQRYLESYDHDMFLEIRTFVLNLFK